MRLAIISDIHGNLEAFKEVLADIEKSQVNEIISLGDNVGYGPEPELVVQLLRDQRILAVMGNHELALTESRYYKNINPSAKKSIDLTRKLIPPATLQYCASLPKAMIRQGSLCVHGSPPDSITRYLFEPDLDAIKLLFSTFHEPICFFGHTHLLKLYSYDQNICKKEPFPEGVTALDPGKRYLVNAGSVGQPRDGNNQAKYLIWDKAAQTLEVRFIRYNIRITAERILELGFPDYNAARLY